VGSREATRRQWQRCIYALKTITNCAGKRGILFALETHPGQLMDNTSSTLRLIRKVGASNLKVILDIWHLFNEGGEDPLKATLALLPYVVHVHAKNMMIILLFFRNLSI